MKKHRTKFALLMAISGASPYCVAATDPAPESLLGMLQVVSAGHTGCLPGDNVLSGVAMHYDSDSGLWAGTWNAACNGKLYLCSAVTTNKSEAFSCAPVPVK